MKFFIFDFSPIDRMIIRLFSFLSSWIASMRAAYRLRIAPNVGYLRARWLAHALNGRRVGGVACDGELGAPAVASLVG
ncbi:hypothetical protein GCM10010873_16510 [Cypionkella aquatica]|uniref:Uncharacterized protein n=1 Tax=Cypionkella aquatica TaxID=1756042 RepID=A0AA37TSE3_9RHOB|nr:hypothetical protein [Cypionkella aquatica]GLS86677.1 hypothetical protein GCM10010873_16510 [Cypionkella aquatica]